MRASPVFPTPSVFASIVQSISARSIPKGGAGLLLAALLLLTVPATAQVPTDSERQRAVQRLRSLDAPEKVKQAVSETPRLQSASAAKLSTSSADYFTRAGAGLAGVNLGSSTLGDVNNDGDLDLVITARDRDSNPTTALYLGDGSGGFTKQDAGLVDLARGGVSLGDVNNDQNLDLVIAGRDGDSNPTTVFYLGDGSGGFTKQDAGLADLEGGSVSLGDVNNDQNLDLVLTGDGSSGRATVLYLGDGSGGFTKQDAGLPDVGQSSSTALQDVDSDGNLDLVISGSQSNGDLLAEVYLGDGSGGFTKQEGELTNISGRSISFGDVDNDENLDLVITGLDSNLDPTTELYLGDGTGGFTKQDVGLPDVSPSNSLGDVDNDGNLDLVIAGRDASGNATTLLYLGDGSGGFAKQDAGFTGVPNGSTSLGDVDGDGDPDLVVTGYGDLFGYSARLYVNRTIQQSPNQAPIVSRVPDPFVVAPGRTVTRTVEAGDPDGDRLSLTLSQGGGTSGVSFSDKGNGVGELTFSPSLDQAGETYSFTLEADDGNGETDTKSFQIEVGDSFFALDVGIDYPQVFSISSSVGDLNNDGDLDLVVTGEDVNGDTTATVYLGDGSGGFTEKQDAGLKGVYFGSTSLGDVNNDGDLDLVTAGENASGTATATLYLGDGSGGFTEQNAGLTGGEIGPSTSLGDVNNDGDLDLVIAGYDGSSSTTTLYIGDGTGGFTKKDAGLTDVGFGASSTFGDVNGDGDLDLVITGAFDPIAELYLGDGTGGFTKQDAGLDGVSFGSSSLGDVNNDGNLDLVITGNDDNSNSTTKVYLGDGSGGFSKANAGLDGSVLSSALGDLNGDGNLDLVVSRAAYLGDGAGGFSKTNAGLGFFSTASLGEVTGDARLDLIGGPSVYENLFSPPPPRFTSTIDPVAIAPGGSFSSKVVTSYSEVTLSLTDGSSTPNVSFTDEGTGTGTFAFTPDPSQAGQSFSFTITATNTEGETASTSFTLEVPETIVELGANLTGVSNAASDAADVDGDGNVDVLVAGAGGSDTPTTTLYLNDGDNTFTEAGANLPGITEGAVRFADVDGDGDPDLILTGENDSGTPIARLYENDGSGNFSKAGAGLEGVRSSAVAVVDVGQDADRDVIITGTNDSDTGTATLYENDGTGAFSVADAGFSGIREGDVTVFDADGNGFPDVLLARYGDICGSLPCLTKLYLGGFGGFSESANSLPAGKAVSGTDIDGDGDGDVVLAGPTYDVIGPATRLFRNDILSFSPFDAGLEDVSSPTVRTHDLNGDSAPDVVLSGKKSTGEKTAAFYRNLGTEFDEPIVLTGVENGSTTFFDVDGDADQDVLVTGSGTATIYQNKFDPVEATSSKTVASSGTKSFEGTGASVDFNDTEGSGSVKINRYDKGPRFTKGIPSDATVSEYRLVAEADTSLDFAPDTKLRLDVSAFQGINDPSTVTIYRRPTEGSGTFEDLETTYDEEAGELVAPVSGLSEFTLASTDPANGLPVELASFDANTTGEAATLRWTTASETNNAGFAVQHRADTTGQWTELGFVESKAEGGTAAGGHEYRFRAEGLAVGTHQFRLKQVDIDGSAQHSRVIEASVRMQEAYRLEAYPNPARQQATVEVVVREEQDATLRLYDVLGRRVATLHDGVLPAQETRTLSLRTSEHGLSSGTYFLRLVGETGTRTRRLTIVR